MQYKSVFRCVDACYALLMLLNDLFLEQAILCPSTDEQGICHVTSGLGRYPIYKFTYCELLEKKMYDSDLYLSIRPEHS